jgi:RNA polymerase sigma-70 factor, ECF subfamily
LSRDAGFRPFRLRHGCVALLSRMTGSKKVVRLIALPSGRALLAGLREGDQAAARQFVDGHRAHVERVLTRILGWHSELDDLTQEVFVRAFARVDEVHEGDGLRTWLTAIAVFVAREAIRKRRRQRWLLFRPSQDVPDIPGARVPLEARAALRAFYEVVDEMDFDVRVAFTLRCVDGMELTEIAEACDVSLATIKRRLRRALDDFYRRGQGRDELAAWFEEGSRWRQTES